MRDKAMNILLVDDDEVDIIAVKRAFEKNKITNPLHVARNGVEALALLRGNGTPSITPKPRIILLDLNMPQMNGIDFLKELRTDPQFKDVIVIVLTTSNEERDIIEAYKLNVAGYILKPVSMSKFIEAIALLDMYWTLSELP